MQSIDLNRPTPNTGAIKSNIASKSGNGNKAAPGTISKQVTVTICQL